MKAGILLLLCFVALLWAVELVNWALDHRLNAYGILPRTQQGAWGIAFAPLLHGGASHLASNTLPLLILGGFVALYGGMIFGVLPQGGFVSWESHLFGLLVGVVAGWCVRPGRGYGDRVD